MAISNRSIATVMTRPATDQLPRTRANSAAAVDAGSVEICNLQLPQSMLKAVRLTVHGRRTLETVSQMDAYMHRGM